MWYSDLFRRHLLDMHIEDWDEEFLSAFSPETYVDNLAYLMCLQTKNNAHRFMSCESMGVVLLTMIASWPL